MPTSNINLTFRDGGTGDAGDPYTGLDRCGRLLETLWKQSTTGDPRMQSKYGRNQVGGVVSRKDEQAHTLVHEISHRNLGTHDHGYFAMDDPVKAWQYSKDGNNRNMYSLPFSKLVDNADTWAQFADSYIDSR